MRPEKVVIVDYGLGNLLSVQRALEYCGVLNVCVSSAVKDVASADRLILPGVGAFEDGIRGLKKFGLVDPIRHHARIKKPMLGICLGMQLLATVSEEFGTHAGLNLIPGRVVSIPRVTGEGVPRKIPFVGWARLSATKQKNCKEVVFSELSKNQYVYLVHSLYLRPNDDESILAKYSHQGAEITAAVRSENTYGFQFHPEKSGVVGLDLLKAFLKV